MILTFLCVLCVCVSLSVSLCVCVSKGKFYLLVEELSQLFRALLPIQLWYKYIMGEDPSSSYMLGAMLIIIYSLCKVNQTEPQVLHKC